MTPPFVVVGVPENRRVGMFQDALAKQGLPRAHVVSWLDIARDPSVLDRVPHDEAIVRIDSAGESWDVDREFLRLGFPDAKRAGCQTIAPPAIERLANDRGRILCPRQHHLGFLVALAELEKRIRPGWKVLTTPRAIRDLFDKRVTSRLYASRGIPVPKPLDVSSADELRASGVGSAFVKLSCGSSASCLVLWTNDVLLTSMEIARAGWYNNLKVSTYRDRAVVDEILAFLFREGAQVEESVPKAKLDDRWFDCRVLAVAGEPAFTVVRTSGIPITNLHLGGSRGDLSRLRDVCPPAQWDAAMETCRRVAACHDTIQIGIDLLFESGFTGHRVVEANAFGDLLPNLERDGFDVYGWQIKTAREAHARGSGP